MKILDLVQGSPEWHKARRGIATASRFSEIITAAKGELSKSAAGYISELVGERYVPNWKDVYPDFETVFMKRGKDLEAEAREAFIAETMLDVQQVGFVLAPDGICGCSPDGLIFDADRGAFVSGAEIKCPIPKTHIGYIMEGGLPDEYKQQVHGSMAVTGLNEWHFFAYFPGMRPHHVIVQRDEYTAKVEAALASFVSQYRDAMAIADKKVKI